MNTTTQDVAVQTYTIDPSHSRFGFTVRHMGFTKVRGHFEHFEGTVQMSPDDLTTLRAEATVQSASITTADPKRDEHLRSEDFFNVQVNPALTFKSTGVRSVDGQRFTLLGELSMRGVTKPVEFDAEYLGEGTDPWGGTRVAFEAHTTINRKDFGLNWNAVLEAGGLLVSEDVRIDLEIQAVQQQEQEG
jgi:polyisoprenoid-binding protein YceI